MVVRRLNIVARAIQINMYLSSVSRRMNMEYFRLELLRFTCGLQDLYEQSRSNPEACLCS